jgi:hypothetical protein
MRANGRFGQLGIQGSPETVTNYGPFQWNYTVDPYTGWPVSLVPQATSPSATLLRGGTPTVILARTPASYPALGTYPPGYEPIGP